MKNLKTGDITPPIPHDQYTSEFDKRVVEEQKNRDAKAKSKAASHAPAVEKDVGTHVAKK